MLVVPKTTTRTVRPGVKVLKGKFLKSQISGMKAWMQRTETSVSFSAVDTDDLGAGADGGGGAAGYGGAGGDDRGTGMYFQVFSGKLRCFHCDCDCYCHCGW